MSRPERPTSRRNGVRRVRRRRLSAASRLALAAILVTATAVAVASVVGLVAGDRAVRDLVDRRLDAIRVAEQVEVGAWLDGRSSALTGIAASPTAATRLARLSEGFGAIVAPTGLGLAGERTALLARFDDEVVPTLSATTGRMPDPRRLIPETATGVHLQHWWFVTEADADGGSVPPPSLEPYLEVHGELDPDLREIADRLGAEQLVLIDGRGDVVYSSDASLDVATNLLVGPYSGQALATTARRVLAGELTGTASTDLVLATAAGGRPVRYVVAPIPGDARADGTGPVGVLAARFGVAPINEVLRGSVSGGIGLGETGEVLVAGPDGTLRSDPRAFQESPTDYLDRAVAVGTMSEADAALARARGSVALVQRADGDVVAASMSTGSGLLERTDHLGREAIMAFGQLGVGDEPWVVISQVTAAEPDEPQAEYRRTLMFAAAVLIALTTFGAVAWANRMVRPVRVLGERHAGADDPVASPLAPVDGIDGIDDERPVAVDPVCADFERLVEGFDAVQATLVERRRQVERARDERRRVLRSLLPAPVAARVEAGDRTVVDRVPSVSVVVVVLHAVERFDLRELESEIAELDAAAARQGLERVKLIGDACFFAVGHLRPYLDHARRAVDFGVAVAGAGSSTGVGRSVGVATGPVGVGLCGAGHLVHDVWGPTVTDAERRARRTAVGRVAIGSVTRSRLPAGVEVEPADAEDFAFVVVGGSGR